MRIKSIAFTNFKGASNKYTLSPITVFVGNNFAGKSSIIEAKTLAEAGYLPGIEKKPGMIHERLASGDNMSVITEYDDGKLIAREYTSTEGRDGTRKVSCKVNSRGLPVTYAVDPVLVDANEFLGLSPSARVSFLFQRLRVTGELVTPASLFEKLGKQPIAVSEAAAVVIAAMEEESIGDHEAAVTAGLPPQAWLESAVLKYAEQKKQAARALADKQGEIEHNPPFEMLALDKTGIRKRLDTAQEGCATASKALEDARVALRAAKPALNTTTEQRRVDKAESALNRAVEEYREAKAELDGIKSLKCCPKCQAKNKGWRGKIEKAAKSILADRENHGKKCRAELTAAKKALAAQQAEIQSASAEQETELTNAVTACQSAVAQAEAEYQSAAMDARKLETQENEEGRRKTQQRQVEALNLRSEILKELCSVAQAALADMVASSMVPFLTRVNALCEGILPNPVCYLNGELGMQKVSNVPHGTFWTWRSFSGAEKSLFMCAVQIALAAESSQRVAVLDEIGRLDEGNREKVRARALSLIEEEKLDQAILIDAGNKTWWIDTAEMTQENHPDLMAVIEVK
jgi:hypothetical protein